MKCISIVIASLLSVNAPGQALTKGLIMPDPDGPFRSCCVYIPTTGLVAYDRPNGKSVAALQREHAGDDRAVYKAFIKSDQGLKAFDYTNFYMVGYEIMAMVYVDKRGDFVKTNSGFWLSVSELRSKGLVLTTWMDYLIRKQDVLGWYANEPGLNLRAEATTSAEILATLKGDRWRITPTNETKGLWCKVTVKEYKNHPCTAENDVVIRTLTGWVKLLSDEQTPNVWNYAKGC